MTSIEDITTFKNSQKFSIVTEEYLNAEKLKE